MSALSGLRVLDLSRVLAGPVCTQILGDLGADIIKIERPFEGDDTRKWGPPFVKDAHEDNTTESAYYLCANRNKRSVAIDIAKPKGQELIRALAVRADILVENFKVDGLKKYGLDYPSLRALNPRLIYASITGFGRAGPLAHEPGYDFITQGMSGFMAATGPVDGPPTKAGVAISDYVTGLYTAIGVLAALNHRAQSGAGQQVDLSLLGCSLAMMTNVAQYFLTSGHAPPRVGNAHATIVPYQNIQTSDGAVIIAVGNDHQFRALSAVCGHAEWADDPRFATNQARLENRAAIVALLQSVVRTRTTSDWLDVLRDADVPCGPVYSVDQAFADPQTISQGMIVDLPHPYAPDPIRLVASPLKMSETPPVYRYAPPVLGQDTREVLIQELGLDDGAISVLATERIIQCAA